MAESAPPGKPGLLKRLWGGGGPEKTKTKTVHLPVNAYGKLPIYKDFISSGMTDAPAREFRGWLDKGFSHRWSNDDACREVPIPPHSFLFRLPDSKGCAAGSLWGSSDEGGLRKFPFALFFSFPKDHAAADPVAAVEYLGEVERRASELRFLFGPGASLSSFYQSYRGAELDVAIPGRDSVRKDFRSELSEFSIGELAESLFGDDASAAWPGLLASAGNGADDPGAVRLPLSGRLPRAREVEFWLLWLERQDPKGRRPVTGVLYPHGHNPGRAVFFFRDVRPEDFLLLHPTRSDLTLVHEPLGRKAIEIPEERPAPLAPPPPPPPPSQRRPPAPTQPSVSRMMAEDGEASSRSSAAEGSVAPAPPVLPDAVPPPAPPVAPETAPAVPAAAADAVDAPAPESSAPPKESSPPPAVPGVEGTALPEDAIETQAMSAAAASPFPEADVASEPTSGGRLSQIIRLDDAARAAGEDAPVPAAPSTPAAAEGAGIPETAAPAPPAEAAPASGVAASEAVSPGTAPSEPAPPAEVSGAVAGTAAALPAAVPSLPAEEVPAAPPEEAGPESEEAAPAAPPARRTPPPLPVRPRVEPPPGWERPLASLLEP